MKTRLNWESPRIGEIILAGFLQKIEGLTETLEGRFEKENLVLVYAMEERKKG
jgi:hypothetical protein